ncbi:MAG: glycosyltransferase family 2 protein [Candidatus Parvarchaeum sp.]
MKISVVITAYDRTDFLLSALASAINASKLYDAEYEYVVALNYDNAAIDNVLARIPEVIRVRVPDVTPLGYELAMAVRKATGDIICFLDDDDRFQPNKFKVIGEYFIKHPEVTYIRNDTLIYWESEKMLGLHNWQAYSGTFYTKDIRETITDTVNEAYMCNLSAISVNRQYYSKYIDALESITTIPDEFTFYTMLNEDTSIAFLPERLTIYRNHASLATPEDIAKWFIDVQKSIDTLKSLLKYFTSPEMQRILTIRINEYEDRIKAMRARTN